MLNEEFWGVDVDEESGLVYGLVYGPFFFFMTRILFHLAALCDSLRCGAYGTYCYGIS